MKKTKTKTKEMKKKDVAFNFPLSFSSFSSSSNDNTNNNKRSFVVTGYGLDRPGNLRTILPRDAEHPRGRGEQSIGETRSGFYNHRIGVLL